MGHLSWVRMGAGNVGREAAAMSGGLRRHLGRVPRLLRVKDFAEARRPEIAALVDYVQSAQGGGKGAAVPGRKKRWRRTASFVRHQFGKIHGDSAALAGRSKRRRRTKVDWCFQLVCVLLA
ncbi:unnamed protein product [Ostreobium quekettii]|uniref:Uncharacterized protein n=1 Tax=Ostreobium quekettii TaxID=121088 RepID=A0A8S1IW86_9CHLO|nr:unnamed protein product [Ostreobium quekettii]